MYTLLKIKILHVKLLSFNAIFLIFLTLRARHIPSIDYRHENSQHDCEKGFKRIKNTLSQVRQPYHGFD